MEVGDPADALVLLKSKLPVRRGRPLVRTSTSGRPLGLPSGFVIPTAAPPRRLPALSPTDEDEATRRVLRFDEAALHPGADKIDDEAAHVASVPSYPAVPAGAPPSD
jgi:hypothetical protein